MTGRESLNWIFVAFVSYQKHTASLRAPTTSPGPRVHCTLVPHLDATAGNGNIHITQTGLRKTLV